MRHIFSKSQSLCALFSSVRNLSSIVTADFYVTEHAVLVDCRHLEFHGLKDSHEGTDNIKDIPLSHEQIREHALAFFLKQLIHQSDFFVYRDFFIDIEDFLVGVLAHKCLEDFLHLLQQIPGIDFFPQILVLERKGSLNLVSLEIPVIFVLLGFDKV